MENYNLYLKNKLGRKHNLNWNLFINFIKNEFIRIYDKLTKNTEKNIEYISHKTKFGTEKYTENNFKLNLNLKLNNDNIIPTDFIWLKNNNNSCRYDVFITLYIFCLFDYLEDNFILLNDQLKDIQKLMRILKNDPNEHNKSMIWNYFILKQIDISTTEIDNKNIIVETGFGISGYVVQLLKIFKNNTYFCLKEQRHEKCEICGYDKVFEEEMHNHLLVINEFTVKIKNIETILSYSLIYDGLTNCEICKLGENTTSCRIYYNIINYPKYLFILFDFSSYTQILKNEIYIKNLLVPNIEFKNTIKYRLKGCITAPYANHFTFIIYNLDTNNIPNNLIRHHNYYYDDNDYNNRFLEFDNLENLYKFIKSGYKIIPYLAVFEKFN